MLLSLVCQICNYKITSEMQMPAASWGLVVMSRQIKWHLHSTSSHNKTGKRNITKSNLTMTQKQTLLWL